MSAFKINDALDCCGNVLLQLLQRSHRLLNGCLVIDVMDIVWSRLVSYSNSQHVIHRLTEVNRLDAEFLKALCTCLLAVFVRAVDFIGLATLDKSELGCEENIVALSGALEPFAKQLFTVAVETMILVSSFFRANEWSWQGD